MQDLSNLKHTNADNHIKELYFLSIMTFDYSTLLKRGKEQLPETKAITEYKEAGLLEKAFEEYGNGQPKDIDELHAVAKSLLADGKESEAWKLLLTQQEQN